MTVPERQPFELGSGERGVLLVHGFTGTPFEMRFLGQRLAERGFAVSAPLLAGHNQTPAALDATTWHDWVHSAELALGRLAGRCHTVAVVGMSLGGLIALRLARLHPDLAATGVLGAPLWLPRRVTGAIRALHWLVDRMGLPLPPVPKIGGADVRDADMQKLNPSLNAFPVHALASLVELAADVRAEVPRVTTPLFVAHADHDHVAPPACARELVERVGTTDVRFLTLPRSFHIITIDVERELLADALGGFLSEKMEA